MIIFDRFPIKLRINLGLRFCYTKQTRVLGIDLKIYEVLFYVMWNCGFKLII